MAGLGADRGLPGAGGGGVGAVSGRGVLRVHPDAGVIGAGGEAVHRYRECEQVG